MQHIVLVGLKQIPFFSHLPDKNLNDLAATAKQLKFAKGDTIITEGENTSPLYVVLAGRARVITSYDVGKHVDLLILDRGSYFGEMALLTGEPRAATIQAIDKCVCAMISKNSFKAWIDAHLIEINMLGVVTEKIGYLNEKTQQMALSSAYEKIVKVLKNLAQQEGNALVISVQPTIHELAELVGASEGVVKTIMQELKKNKYVLAKGKALQVASILPETW